VRLDIPAGQVQHLIESECDALKALLVSKNAAYGNSALDPVRIFSKVDRVEQIRVRLDDKLSRLARGSAAGEDVGDELGDDCLDSDDDEDVPSDPDGDVEPEGS
jgi:hypothetical protein